MCFLKVHIFGVFRVHDSRGLNLYGSHGESKDFLHDSLIICGKCIMS